jgi:hypothetical protein
LKKQPAILEYFKIGNPNVFITGFLEPDSDEATLLSILEQNSNIILVYSNDLDEQVSGAAPSLTQRPRKYEI